MLTTSGEFDHQPWSGNKWADHKLDAMAGYQNAFSQFLAVTDEPPAAPGSAPAQTEKASDEGPTAPQAAQSLEKVGEVPVSASEITPTKPPTEPAIQSSAATSEETTKDSTQDLNTQSNENDSLQAQPNKDKAEETEKPETTSAVNQKTLNVPHFERSGTPESEGLPSSGKSIGSKLDQIAQKLIGGMVGSARSTEQTVDEETPTAVISPEKNLPQDEEAVALEGVDESLGEPPPERPFSELLPPSEDSQPEFVEELVSDNLPMDFGETLEETSETGSQNNQSDQLMEETDTGLSTPVTSIVDDSKTEPNGNSEVSGLPLDEPESTVGFTEEPDDTSHLLHADKVFEYQWPIEMGGDIFMLQEQISEYIGIVSFKRKYPDLTRRPVEYKERIYLLEKNAVTETQCDLGLTALRSEEVYELLAKDYPDKYKEYLEVLREKERKRIAEANKEYNMQSIEKAKMDFFLKKAVKSAAEFNAQFMREKREERRAYFDLQTFEVQFPRSKYKPMQPEMPKELDPYPLALIPGQYQSYYKRYTSQELKYFPVKTALYSPHKELKYFPVKTALYSPHKALRSIYAEPEEPETADDDKDDSSSSDDSQSGSSDSDADSIEAETANKNQISEEQIKKLLATPRPDTPPKKTRKRAANQNGGDTGDSERDSETSSVKAKPKRTPGRRGGPGRGRKTFVKEEDTKAEIPRCLEERCVICQEMEVNGVTEEVLQCSECKKLSHPSCVDMTPEMIPIIKTYHWQCMECKTCIKCEEAHDEDKMMFCDLCDRGYHTYCVGLSSIPPGRWVCPACQERAQEAAPTPKKKGRPFKVTTA